MYHFILIYTDGSTLSHKAVNAGIALAAALDAQALAYSVVPKYPHWNAETGMAMTLSETANFENERAMEAQAIVDAVQKEAHTLCQNYRTHRERRYCREQHPHSQKAPLRLDCHGLPWPRRIGPHHHGLGSAARGG
jgi:nucleotide-binding universal stress UspA family protein